LSCVRVCCVLAISISDEERSRLITNAIMIYLISFSAVALLVR